MPGTAYVLQEWLFCYYYYYYYHDTITSHPEIFLMQNPAKNSDEAPL